MTSPASTESVESIRAKVSFYMTFLNCIHSVLRRSFLTAFVNGNVPAPLDDSGNDTGDKFWRALDPVLRDAGFVLWKYEGSLFQYTLAGGDPSVNGFGYIILHRSHATAIGGDVANLRMFRYLVSVIRQCWPSSRCV